MAIGDLEIDSLSTIYACEPLRKSSNPFRGTGGQFKGICAWLPPELDLGSDASAPQIQRFSTL